MVYSVLELEDHARFLRNCDFLGERAQRLAEELASLLEEHIEADLSLNGYDYCPSSLMYLDD